MRCCLYHPTFSRFCRTLTCDRHTDTQRQTKGHGIYCAEHSWRGKNGKTEVIHVLERQQTVIIILSLFKLDKPQVTQSQAATQDSADIYSLYSVQPTLARRPSSCEQLTNQHWHAGQFNQTTRANDTGAQQQLHTRIM